MAPERAMLVERNVKWSHDRPEFKRIARTRLYWPPWARSNGTRTGSERSR